MNMAEELVKRLIQRGEVLQAELVARTEKVSKKKVKTLIEQYGMGGVKRVYC